VEGDVAEQTFAQVPQLLLSVCASRQTALHSVLPIGQFEIVQLGAMPLHIPFDWQMRVALPERA
jgi:hypothetical protein